MVALGIQIGGISLLMPQEVTVTLIWPAADLGC